MPFTFSHPAFILPAKYFPSKYISFTGLIIGSIVPDFEYFFRMDVESYYSHSLAGILYFNLPVVFLMSLLFHIVIKRPLAFNLPSFISSRFTDTVNSDFLSYLKKNIIVFIISSITGIASHLFFDAFTHKTGYFVRELTILNSQCNFSELRVPWYRFLQHITSITGLIILCGYILKLPENRGLYKSKKSYIFQYWILLLVMTGLLMLLRYFLGKESTRIGYWAINTISCGMISLTVISVLWKLLKRSY